MAGSLQQKADGSFALFIRGDLQFDSTDERIYHESLVLPAMALAAKRTQSPLKVLIIGGGDGLVARELFKSELIESVNLVDYDPEILNFAQDDLKKINDGSLRDPRMSMHIQDAWGFVDGALAAGKSYDLIVSDLTVPDDLSSARFHTVDWYAKLSQLLTKQGILAVNAVSPQATPRAYWCIFNSMLKGGLRARPFHIHIPSFTAQGFGQDWGFFLASKESINFDQIEDLLLAEPRAFLKDNAHLLELFEFPSEFFAHQPNSRPAACGSDILLQYFRDAKTPAYVSDSKQSSLTLNTDSLHILEPDTGKTILPPEIGELAARSIYSESEHNQSENAEVFLYGVLDLMPSLNREHTKEVIEDFLADPESFLQAVDLPDLVARLLKRAMELPAQLVAELEALSASLQDWAGDVRALLNLGQRVVTILMLVIVVGNLLYPDMAYGKGEGAHAQGAHIGARGDRGRGRGRGGYGANWGGGSTWVNRQPVYYNNAPGRTINTSPQHVPHERIWERKQPAAPNGSPSGALPLPNHIGSAQYPDISGKVYPSKRFRFDLACVGMNDQSAATSVAEHYAVYKLGRGADVLPTGHIVMPLTEQSYLMVGPESMHLIDQDTGHSILSLDSSPSLLSGLNSEVDFQLQELMQESTSSKYLHAARQLLSRPSTETPAIVPPGAVETFPNAWITPNGRYIVIKLSDGSFAYLDGNGWYSNEGTTRFSEPYPEKLRSVVSSYLSQSVRDVESTHLRLVSDKKELIAYLNVLTKELASYKTSEANEVTYGSRQIVRSEAVRLTEAAINKVVHKITLLDQYAEKLPGQIDLAKIALAHLISQDA